MSFDHKQSKMQTSFFCFDLVIKCLINGNLFNLPYLCFSFILVLLSRFDYSPMQGMLKCFTAELPKS